MTHTARADLVTGGAAANARAIATADQGLRVLVAEKTGELGGAACWPGGGLTDPFASNRIAAATATARRGAPASV